MKKLSIVLFVVLLFPCVVCAETILDIFPDENVARYIRDEIGAFDVTDEVTQEQLDEVWNFANFDGYGEIHDVTGISRLHNLMFIDLSSHWQSDVMITQLPEEVTTMDWVTSLDLNSLDDLQALPESIGDMKSLTRIDLSGCGITSLPDSICELQNLESLIISECPIEKLPENIGNLKNLKRLDISDTKITSLPESIKELQLEEFRRSGTPL